MPALSHRQYREVFGFPVEDYYRRLGLDFDREPYERIATEFIVEYDRRRFECDLQPSAAATLRAVASAGVTQSILSAYQQESLQEAVEFYGLGCFFERLIGLGDPYANGKAGQGQRLLRELEADPAEVLLVGDTTHDYEVAIDLGVDCVLVPAGHHDRTRLVSCGVPVVASLAEIGERLG